jgi:hypothetical protein
MWMTIPRRRGLQSAAPANPREAGHRVSGAGFSKLLKPDPWSLLYLAASYG